jgi:hypothetical protein
LDTTKNKLGAAIRAAKRCCQNARGKTFKFPMRPRTLKNGNGACLAGGLKELQPRDRETNSEADCGLD